MFIEKQKLRKIMFGWEKLAQDKIKEAMLKGEFDNLPGEGKPLDLTDYFKAPAHLRLAIDVLKKSNALPPPILIKKEITEIQQQIKNCKDADAKANLEKKLQFKEIELAINLEKYSKK
ncbi:MAG: DUF1992 domain-containing protein [Calditrichae bacterium]|nr:DUF1992 domain-containing protein [Calditrichia bacterium]